MTPREQYILEQAIKTLYRIESAKKPKWMPRKPKRKP